MGKAHTTHIAKYQINNKSVKVAQFMGYRYELYPNWFTLDRQVRALDMIKNKKMGSLKHNGIR